MADCTRQYPAGDADCRRRLARGEHAVFESRFSADAFAAALREACAGLGVTPEG